MLLDHLENAGHGRGVWCRWFAGGGYGLCSGAARRSGLRFRRSGGRGFLCHQSVALHRVNGRKTIRRQFAICRVLRRRSFSFRKEGKRQPKMSFLS
ncbi:hypothetical protein GMO_19960 [Gluconobacter morbifer G707]|uniref:Uncharacterized protein n=1 Tax=Gluconobacter morbifer G707 TaxID=1088869 RepID=G6XKI0_9PROT|nr:hypothetical protein GMO_19960 [Gluconobacter morbifer G707]